MNDRINTALGIAPDAPRWRVETALRKLVREAEEVRAARAEAEAELGELRAESAELFIQAIRGCNQHGHKPGCPDAGGAGAAPEPEPAKKTRARKPKAEGETKPKRTRAAKPKPASEPAKKFYWQSQRDYLARKEKDMQKWTKEIDKVLDWADKEGWLPDEQQSAVSWLKIYKNEFRVWPRIWDKAASSPRGYDTLEGWLRDGYFDRTRREIDDLIAKAKGGQ